MLQLIYYSARAFLKMNGTIAISVSLFCLVSQNYFDFFSTIIYFLCFFTYFLKQLKLKPKIVCYTTFNLNIGRCLISA